MLHVKPLSDETAITISEIVRQTMEMWEIAADRVAFVSTDNAANMLAAVRDVGLTSVPCFIHTMQLVITAGLKDHSAETLLAKARKIVGHFKHSGKLTTMLLDKQIGACHPLTVVQEVPTRWNSTYDMIDRLVQIKESVELVLVENRHRNISLTDQEYIELEDLLRVLKPFKAATVVLSSESTGIASLVIPLINGFIASMDSLSSRVSSGPAFDVKMRIVENMGRLKHYLAIESLQLATFLDPRFKDFFLPEADRSGIREKVLHQMTSFENTMELHTREPNLIEELIPMLKMSRASPLEHQDVELKRYTTEDRELCTVSPLSWWRDNGKRFPNLSSVAMKYLGYSPTSVSCERLFSKSGYISGGRRSSLSPTSVCTLVFLNGNQQLSLDEAEDSS